MHTALLRLVPSMVKDDYTLRTSLSGTRFSYATEGALVISSQLSMQRRGQRPSKGLGTNMTVEATERQSTHVNRRGIHPG